MKCPYCTEDCDGYVSILPRTGKGRASIQNTMKGPHIAVSLPHKTQLDIPITFCPMCGRRLKYEAPDA